MKKDKVYKYINLIRVLACLAILLFHLGLLKGGYLAVCTFFVLSGYLVCVSAFKKDKFSFKSYYFNRLKKIYLPLLIVVFLTISVISIIPSISWFNLKPETKSILLGVNNFWQINANLNYFSKHFNSPFTHLWYIAILIQFDLVFPFIYIFLRKLGDKINKYIPCVLTFLVAIIGTVYFFIMSKNQSIMVTYYNTFTRLFSLSFGVSLGFIHHYFKSFIFKNKLFRKFAFYGYLLVLLIMFIFVDANSVFFPFAMILTTLISCRLIDYSTISKDKIVSRFDKFISYFSNISYEIYLIQYPVMFLFQYVDINNYLRIFVIIVITIILSCILHYLLDYNKEKKFKILYFILSFLCLTCSIYGVYQFCITVDHTPEMKALEKELSQNQKMIQEKQKEYALNMKKEEEDWTLKLQDLGNSEADIKNIVNNLPVVGVGDSIMLGAVDNLYKEFPNGYFDAAISRTAWTLNGILLDLKNRNLLSDVIVVNLGANGDCSESCKLGIMKTAQDRDILWVNVTNDDDVHVNDKLATFASNYDNFHIIDWNSISKGHPEYFVSDGIHLTQEGRKAYTETVYNAIYNLYVDKFKERKEELIRKHEEEMKFKISFYGNDIILNSYDYLKNYYGEANFVLNKGVNYDIIKLELEKVISDNSLNHRVIFSFDDMVNLSKEQYQNLINLCGDKEIYILATNEKTSKNLLDFSYDNVKVMDFYQEIKNNKDYLMIDGKHLSPKGNEALGKFVSEIVK